MKVEGQGRHTVAVNRIGLEYGIKLIVLFIYEIPVSLLLSQPLLTYSQEELTCACKGMCFEPLLSGLFRTTVEG